MKLDDAEQAKYEALAEAIGLCLKPLINFAASSGSLEGTIGLERAEDQATLALMKLVDDAYKQGRHDNNEEWLEVEHSHFEQ